jgi:hypothetical protein
MAMVPLLLTACRRSPNSLKSLAVVPSTCQAR